MMESYTRKLIDMDKQREKMMRFRDKMVWISIPVQLVLSYVAVNMATMESLSKGMVLWWGAVSMLFLCGAVIVAIQLLVEWLG